MTTSIAAAFHSPGTGIITGAHFNTSSQNTSGQNPGLCRPETQDGFVQSGIVTKTGLRTAAGALKPSSLARLLPQP